ncbi:MAG: TonB-dependent receptor [Acidobacteria bacterium]|nr:TonB-dependent receptor [Acidobacteriota bacterium]
MRVHILWLGILGGVIPALAQDPATVPSSSQTPTVHDEVLVTGVLTEESRHRLPVSADVIGQEEIEERQATTVADLLRAVPGLDVVRSGSAGKVTSLFTRGTESDHTLVLWNGIELNNPFFGGFDWGLLPTENIGRVEVIRGPFSALYGSDALGGVVQVLTADSPAQSLSLEFGGDGYRRAALSAGLDTGRLRFDVSAHSRRGDGEAENDFYDSDELVARARWRSGNGLELGLLLRGNESDLGIPSSGALATPHRTTAWRELEIALPLEFERERWKIEAQISRASFDSEFDGPDDPFGFTFAESSSISKRARVVTSYRFSDEAWLAVGGEYEDQEVDSSSVFGPGLEGAGQTTRALFSQLFYAVGAWRFDLGLRQDDHDAFGAATSPRLATAWQIDDRNRLWAGYGEGFRSPSMGELFFPFSGNPELEPEKSESVELGYEYRGPAWGVTLTGFRNELDNLIDFDFVLSRNVNIGSARTRGVELGTERRWRSADLRANVTYLEAIDRDSGLDLLRRPEWRGSLVGSWRPGNWVRAVTVLYVGERADVDPITFARAANSAYERLDLALRYRGWRRLVPYARVENVTDEHYAEALGFPAPGRQLIGGLSLSWQPDPN